MQEGLTFWNIFWLIAIIIPLFLTWAFGLVDVFRRDDLSGLARVVWILFILLIPIVGIIVYFLFRPVTAEEAAWRDHDARAARSYGETGFRSP